MSPQLVATLWWSLLLFSVLLTVLALPLWSWRLLLLAAGCSLAFAIAGIFSIGVLILLFTGFQLVMAAVFYRGQHTSQV